MRVGSYNKALLRATLELLPEDVNLEIFGIDGIPPFNEDIEKDMPTKVRALPLRMKVEADAILIATPEYNYRVPGVLKNAIDWAS